MARKEGRKGWMAIADPKTAWACPLEDIVVRKEWNSRRNYGDIEELARSIYENGVRMPLRGYYNSDLGKIVLTDGFRRMDAIARANEMGASIEKVLMLSEDPKANEGERLLTQLICNDGKALEPLEQADVIRRLINYGWTDSEIARRIGKSPSYIGKLSNLAYAEPQVKQFIEAGKVAASTVMNVMSASCRADKVAEVISEAVSIAEQRGKSKAASSVVKEVAQSKGQVHQSEMSEREIEELRQRVCTTCWEQASPSILRKVAKLLDKELLTEKAKFIRSEKIRHANLSTATAANGRAESHTA